MGGNGSAQLRVLVLTAEEGEGHYAAARALSHELLHDAGAEVVVRDAYKEDFGRVVPFFSRDLYHFQVRWLAWTYWLEFVLFAKFAPTRAIARAGLAICGARPLMRLIRRVTPDLIVSTHPAVTSALGYLRKRGRLKLPVVATITDLEAHPLWAHKGVDLHLVMHEACVASVERIAGRDSVKVTRPIVSPAFRASHTREEARAALDLPQDRPIFVVSGGGWAVGDVGGTVRAALGVENALVMCLAGRYEETRERLAATFADEPRVQVLGFTERMPELLAAADALIDSTVGLTCLEALTCGCPIVVHGAPPGHSRDSAKTIARIGLAELANKPSELLPALERTVAANRRPDFGSAPTAGSLIASARLRSTPATQWRRRLVIAAAASVGTLALGGWTFASAVAFPIIARTFGLRGLATVSTPKPIVGLIVAVPAKSATTVARRLQLENAHATFAFIDVPSASTTLALRAAGDGALPAVGPERATELLSLRRHLRAEARALHLPLHFRYLAPHRGLSLAEYLAARSVGGHPIDGSVRLTPGQPLPVDGFRSGAIVVFTLGSSAPSALGSLDKVVARLSSSGLRTVSISALLGSASKTAATARERASMPAEASTSTREAISTVRTSGS